MDFKDKVKRLENSKNWENFGLTMAVIGSRTFSDRLFLYRKLDEIRKLYNIERIVSGGRYRNKHGYLMGADTYAEDYCDTHCVSKLIHPADWKQFGKSAGPKRNRKIAIDADFAVAFWDGSSVGTKDCLDKLWNFDKIAFIIGKGQSTKYYDPKNYS